MSSHQISITFSLTLVLSIVTPATFLIGLLDRSAYAISDFNIDAVGDWGCNSNTQKTVSNIKGKNPERVLALGDYSYQPTATCWLNTINSIKSITRINIGNHENDANEDLTKYLSSFGLSKQYYSFNFQNVHVLTMATEISFGTSSSQYNFVKNDLAAASTNPNIKWIIVNYHRAMYTSPNTCSTSTCHGSSSLRDAYHPLFDKYGVDLVLQGHVHNYQRTFPIKYNPSNPSNPTKTSTSTNTYTDPQGEVFAIVGMAGINFHGLSGKSSFVASQQDSKFGILDIQITNDGSKLQAKHYANDGSVKDQFSISKAPTVSAYHYDPSLSLTGSNFYDASNTSELQLPKFSAAAWFKTSSDFSGDAIIVNKGGFGAEDPGFNMNYGLYMTKDEQVRAGFEIGSGTNFFISSPSKYNNGQWHYAVVTYDGSILRLYLDGSQVGSLSTSGAIPDNVGMQPARIGANSQAQNSFFVGNVDEVRVWNKAISAQEVSSAYGGTFTTSGQVLYIPSSSSISSLKSSPQQTVNITNHATTSEKGSNQTTKNQTINNENTDNTKTPELPKKLNTTKTSRDQGTASTATADQNDQKNKNSTSGSNQNNNNNLEVKPIIPKEAKKTVQPKIRNTHPDANAGKKQMVTEGSEVALDGSKSKDKDGKIESYQWQQISGPKVDLGNANKSKANFVSPSVNHDTVLVFKLTITDDRGGSNSAITAIKVVRNVQPQPLSPSTPGDSTSKNSERSSSEQNVTESSRG